MTVVDRHGTRCIVTLGPRRAHGGAGDLRGPLHGQRGHPWGGGAPDETAGGWAGCEPNPAAWPTSSAEHAAALRWRDRHPTVATVASVRPEPSPSGRTDLDVPSALAATGRAVRRLGVRRLDLRLTSDHPVLADLVGAGWLVGPVGDDVVASWPIAYPWNQPIAGDPPTAAARRAAAIPAWLPPRTRRAVRRVVLSHPSQLPAQARIATTELGATLRTRSVYRGARRAPADGAPLGSHPFAVTRYDTIRRILRLVPEVLRTGPLVDIGAGDGRVLVEAARAGFGRLVGREVDPTLAAEARRRVGAEATIELGDALARDLDDDTAVVYLNNPFDEAGVARLADLIGASLARHPRPMVVAYINPPTLSPLVAAGLVPVHAEPQFTMLATSARRGGPPGDAPGS